MASSVERIERSQHRLAAEVYTRLVDALLQGTLSPGDRLIQDRLAEQLDVSRTPVRDALLRLNEEGVIEASGRRGYVVRTVSADDVRQTYEARYAVEGHAAAMVAESGADAVDQVRTAVKEATTKRLKTPRESFDANRAIHRAVVVATGNAHLLNFFDLIWGRALSSLAYREFYVAAPYSGFKKDHEQLVEDLANRDANHARQAMIDHIRRGLERTPIGDVKRSSASTDG